jgi:hypothetical protein
LLTSEGLPPSLVQLRTVKLRTALVTHDPYETSAHGLADVSF